MKQIKELRKGCLLSPLLANITLTGLETYLNITYREKFYTKNNGKKNVTYLAQGKYRITRYADDFVRQDGSLSSF